jgi:DinB family protein
MAARGAASLARWRRDAARRIRAARAATLAFVGRLPEDEVLRPRTIDRWSVKDVLAHLMTCDEETVRRLRLITAGRADRIHWFESLADADRFNARSVAGARRLGVRAVLGRMARAHADLVRRVGRLPLESLRDPSHAYPVVDWLPAPGWSHEREHLAEIKAWWRAHRARRAPPVSRRAS